MKGDPGEELRGEFETWLEGWDSTLLPRTRRGDGPYLSHHTELAWLAFKAGAARAQRGALLSQSQRYALVSIFAAHVR